MTDPGEPQRLIQWSLLIPVWRDAEALREGLARLGPLSLGWEVIIADASEAEAALAVAQIVRETSRGQGTASIHLLAGLARGRGAQLCAATEQAQGQWLVFHHADTELTPAHVAAIERASAAPGVGATAFYKDLAAHYPRWAWLGRIARWWTRRCGPIYGDQTVALGRPLFEAIGGMRPLPIMEDVDLSRRLRAAVGWGQELRFLDPPLRTSMRRFIRRGTLRTRVQNWLILWLWQLQLLDEEAIYTWYYGQRPGRERTKRALTQ
jgi:hypothetical protein